MATPVPYNPTPTVSPQFEPTPYRHEDVPLAAFGGLTAQALSHLGNVEEGAGKEIFARGLAMQELHEQAAANEASANFTTQGGTMYEQQTSLRGKAAVDGFDTFKNNISKLRDDTASSLTSPFAQLQFNQESRSMMSRFIFNAAGHAGRENTSYILGSLKASDDATINHSLGNPADEGAFQAGLVKSKENNDQRAIINGWGEKESNDNWLITKDKMWAARLQGMAKTQPFTAGHMLDEATKNGDITPQSAAQVSDYIQKVQTNVGARQLATGVLAGDNQRNGAGNISVLQARAGIKAVEGGNYSAIGPETGKGHALGAYQVMEYNLAPWLREAGMPAMTAQEFLRNPTAQDQLFDFKFGQYMKNRGSANEAALDWFGHGKRDVLGTTPEKYLAIFNASLAKHSSLSDLTQEGQRRANESAPDNPYLGQAVTEHIERQYNDVMRIQRDNELRNKETVYSTLEGDKIPATIDEAIHTSPETEEAYNAMSSQDQLKFQRAVNSTNKSILVQTNAAERQKLLGLMTGDADDRAAFMDVDPWSMKLSWADQKWFAGQQRAMAKGGARDPSVERAMQIIQPQLDAAEVSSLDKDSMHKFRGALIDAVGDWHTQNPGKVMNPDVVKAMGSRLLSKQLLDNAWFGAKSGPFGPSSTNLFRLPLPDSQLQQLYKDHPNITDDEVELYREEYVRQRFQELQKAQPTQSQSSNLLDQLRAK